MSENETSSIIVARIVRPHGIRGEVVLESFTDVEDRFENTKKFLLIREGKILRELEVEVHRFFNGRHVLKFSGLSSRNDAETLRDLFLAIQEDELGDLPEGHFFIHDLVGMNVFLKDGTQLGAVFDVMETKGAPLLEVGKKNGLLIPFTDSICIQVDLEHRKIVIDPPEGLLQLNAG